MNKIRLAIVGCGGMGHRHLAGLAELHRSGLSNFELVGACDPVLENAESLAQRAEEYFGKRPIVVGNLEELTALGVKSVDVTTTPRHHHTVVIEALQRGWHAMVEKPMGLTVRACNLMRQASEQSDCILSTAENYRRDPINRLAKALLQAEVIGAPRLLLHNTVGGGDRMLISVWRHQKNSSGVLLDVGVHYADMIEYLLGEVSSVYAQTRLYERIRKNPMAGAPEPVGRSAGGTGVYERWQREMPAEFEATAEDAAYATLLFKNGAVGQYIEDHAGHGQGMWRRMIFGSAGSLELPGDRSGGSITLKLDGREAIGDERILDFVPDFRLDSATAKLFGGERLWRYSFPFPETDRKIIAIEYADFAEAIQHESTPEVDAHQGTRSVALSYAILESGELGRPVTMDDVMSEQVDAYQREINESLSDSV
ncbi:MAG: Gfo/Idh/MocA family protein [Candidatus Poribacteria bacterium]